MGEAAKTLARLMHPHFVGVSQLLGVGRVRFTRIELTLPASEESSNTTR